MAASISDDNTCVGFHSQISVSSVLSLTQGVVSARFVKRQFYIGATRSMTPGPEMLVDPFERKIKSGKHSIKLEAFMLDSCYLFNPMPQDMRRMQGVD